MKEKSTIVALPVVPFNQSKLADVCQYLDYLQDFLSSLPLSEVDKLLVHYFYCLLFNFKLKKLENFWLKIFFIMRWFQDMKFWINLYIHYL